MTSEKLNKYLLHSAFLRKLKFWTLQSIVSALPAFFIAMNLMGMASGRNLMGIFAMLAVVVKFSFLLTIGFTFFESRGPIKDIIFRGMVLGLKLRVGMVMLSLGVIGIAVLKGGSSALGALLLLPDTWLGMLSALALDWISGTLKLESGIASLSNGDSGVGFWTVYFLSNMVAVMIAFCIFTLSFICVLWLQMRDRRKFGNSKMLARNN